MIEQGFTLMFYGISSVFLFLTLLVLTTTIMSKIVRRFAPTPVANPQAQNISTNAVDDKTLAVIRAAITQHRNKR